MAREPAQHAAAQGGREKEPEKERKSRAGTAAASRLGTGRRADEVSWFGVEFKYQRSQVAGYAHGIREVSAQHLRQGGRVGGQASASVLGKPGQASMAGPLQGHRRRRAAPRGPHRKGFWT
jgi:hypothetical protein